MCPDPVCCMKAREGGLLNAHLKTRVPPAVYNQLARIISRDNSRKIHSLLGLAVKAGEAAPGITAVEKGIAAHRIKLIIYDPDMSHNSLKKLRSMARDGETAIFPMKEGRLDRIVGKPNCRAVGITGDGFAASLSAVYTDGQETGGKE